MTIRAIKKVFKSVPTLEGAGVHLRRGIGHSEVPLFDPFLLLDDFRGDHPDKYEKGFPWHPHRGMETITYVIDGQVEHGDSMGNKGTITPGDVQWMTAGSGIIHQEMPKGNEQGRMGGFQLWANLPASHKMMDPRYREIKAADIPEITLEKGATVKIIAGEVEGTKGPVQDIVTDPQYLDVTLPPNSEFSLPIASDHTVFAYVISGKGYFCPDKKPFSFEIQGSNYFDMDSDPLLGELALVLFDQGEMVFASTAAESVRFLLVSGKPIGEPIAWHGPIVMNTQDELEHAFHELQQRTFVKHG